MVRKWPETCSLRDVVGIGKMRRNQGLSFYRRKKKWNPVVVREIFSWTAGVLVAVFLAVVLNYFLGLRIGMVGTSMEPTLENEQYVLVDRFSYSIMSPSRGDVVVFLPNGNPNSHYYVKRVVAVPGDRVRISGGDLYVNDEKSQWSADMILDGGIAENTVTLAAGEYFCMGDNPNSSEDSRSANIGPVKSDDILGKAWFKLSHGEAKMGLLK